ncbi:hypothetical protein [Bdellovibrio sp. HCB337]|uniref:hypothetical protein n=1 Tax=Bdellovibrio sp. HCB337 TaxID=3394358 RepID=UPI0039A5B9BA
MKIQIFSLVLTTCLFAIAPAQAAVWQDTEVWNADWEQAYSDWVNDSFNEEIFITGAYKNIPTDCADAVYAARIIFAYENKLPFVIKDSTGGSGRVTNKMSRFDGSSDSISKVRKFIEYVGDVTSTKTLPNDSFPVVVDREHVRPGTLWSRPRITRDNIWRRIIGGGVQEDPGHAELVKEVSDTGAVYLIGSTVPKEIRKLNTTSSLVFMPIETSTGFRNWMQPSYYGMAETSLPGYSLEQFNEIGKTGVGRRKLSRWTADVQERLALREETKGENIIRQVENLCKLVNARVDIVQKGIQHSQKLGGACMDAGDYDSYSTPSRDKRIKTTLKQLTKTAGGVGLTGPQRAAKLKPHLDQCPNIQISATQTLSLYDFSIALLKGDVSSDPNDPFGARWGLEPSTSKCPKYE